jgi:hypothetical protein
VTVIPGFIVAVEGKVPAVPTVTIMVPVPVPGVTVNVGWVGFGVTVDVGGGCVWVGALVAVITTGVFVGSNVGLGRD